MRTNMEAIPGPAASTSPISRAVAASSQAAAGRAAHAGILSLPPAAEARDAAISPAVKSLLSMANLNASAATLQLYLGEIVEQARNATNALERERIDELTQRQMSILQEKKQRLELAQKKFDEAEKLQLSSNILSKIRLGLSVLLTAVSIGLMATGVGAGAGSLLMLGTCAIVSAVSTVNEALILDNGKGIAGRIAELAGASRSAASNWDMGVTMFLGLLSAVFAAPLIGPIGGVLIGSVDLVNGGLRYAATTSSAEGLDLNSATKHYEALIQELSAFLQHASDNLIQSNTRHNELMASLMRSFSDLSQALSRVRFAG